MIVTTTVRFRARLEPFPWEMDGRTGTSYSFEALDQDDAKVRIKCSEATWKQLASAQRDQPITLTLQVAKPIIASGHEVRLASPAPAGAPK